MVNKHQRTDNKNHKLIARLILWQRSEPHTKHLKRNRPAILTPRSNKNKSVLSISRPTHHIIRKQNSTQINTATQQKGLRQQLKSFPYINRPSPLGKVHRNKTDTFTLPLALSSLLQSLLLQVIRPRYTLVVYSPNECTANGTLRLLNRTSAFTNCGRMAIGAIIPVSRSRKLIRHSRCRTIVTTPVDLAFLY